MTNNYQVDKLGLCIPLEVSILLKIKSACLRAVNRTSNGMYLGIDVGATKTLLGIFDRGGQLLSTSKIPTDNDYRAFLKALGPAIEKLKEGAEPQAVCCAIPGAVDRANGTGIRFGNLSWENVPIINDLARLTGCQKIYVENDAKLGGLSEAILIIKEFKKVLYIPIGTGIGIAVIINGVIDINRSDSGGNKMMFEYDNRHQSWEEFASGRAIVKKYGKKASDIDDPEMWKDYSVGLAVGLKPVIETVEPEVVIIGGGVGAHFDKFKTFLNEELKKYENNMVKMPPIIKARRPEEAVIYGCYDYIKQSL